LARRELDGRVEVTALYDVTAHADRADPGIVAREAAGAALVFALGAEPSPEHLAEVEVLGGRGDPPELHVTGELDVLLAGREVHVSLSHEGSLAAALVVLSPGAP
jgi:phosphopantetheinyl transferase (holo-ACP synthase)